MIDYPNLEEGIGSTIGQATLLFKQNEHLFHAWAVKNSVGLAKVKKVGMMVLMDGDGFIKMVIQGTAC